MYGQTIPSFLKPYVSFVVERVLLQSAFISLFMYFSSPDYEISHKHEYIKLSVFLSNLKVILILSLTDKILRNACLL